MWEAAETTGDKHAQNMVPTVMTSLDPFHSTSGDGNDIHQYECQDL